jgi:hypothetical protein
MKAHQAQYILEQFVDSTNRWNSIFGKEPMTFPLSQQNANSLMDKLAGELSPENLHCDGEISPAQAQRKFRELNTIKKALETYCLNNWLDTPECVY